MKLILLGPPGAGKGTQAARIAEELRIPRVSSGDLFRDHEARDTELGRLARSYMERGVLVPDDVTIKMVMEWIEAQGHAGGFLLDGFPRTAAQAEALNKELEADGGIDTALYLNVSHDEMVRRLSGRFICRGCQTPYNMESAPSKILGVCDKCGAELWQRADDAPAAVGERIRVYTEETEPLVQHYRELGKLKEVDGERPIQEVGEAVMSALGR